MFKGLNALVVPVAGVPAAPKFSVEERRAAKLTTQVRLQAIANAQKQTASLKAIATSLRAMSATTTDFTDLRLLRRVVGKHGLNRPLMAFVNPANNGIARIIKNMPANESLDMVTVGRSDPRTMAALEGLDEALDTEPGLVADWVRTGANNIDMLLCSTQNQINDLGDSVSHALEELENAEVKDEDLAACTTEAVNYDDAVRCIEALLSILPDLDCKVSDPTDRDAMESHKDRLAHTASVLNDHTGLMVDRDNPHQLQMGNKPEAMQLKSGSLVDLGYNAENCVELLKKADCLLDAINGLIERKQTMVDGMNQAADTVAAMDNDVPPAVDGAYSDDDDVSDDDTGMMTQADVVHCHVSSHLCCIASVIDASTDVVQTILGVAQCLDGLDCNDQDVATPEDDSVTA